MQMKGARGRSVIVAA